MTKAMMKIALALFAGSVFASGAYAAPLSLTDAQMDSVAAGGVDKVDGFVCPVITTDAVLVAPNGGSIGEVDGTQYYTIGGPDVAVPEGATNEGFPGQGNFLTPGDVGYTAIWDRANAPAP